MATAIPLVFGIGGQYLGGKFLAGVGIGGHVLGAAGGALVGGIGGMVLGSLLFPQESPSESLPKVGSYQTQTTLSGSAIPVVKGTCRVAGNVIYLGDSHPYTIVHKSGGGGGKGIFGGGGSGVTTTETRYRRSFLIGICEGPATVGRMWRGKEEILTSECTIFEGDGNSGLADVTGLEFGHYKHLCCAWFEEYDLGTSDAVPMFTFEVNSSSRVLVGDLLVGGPAEFLDGTYSIAEGYNIKGDYSHKLLFDSVGSDYYCRDIAVKDKDYFIAGARLWYWGRVWCTNYDADLKWTFEQNNPVENVVIGPDGYVYISGRTSFGNPRYLLKKLNPQTGELIWESLYKAGDYTARMSRYGFGYVCCDGLFSFNPDTGTTSQIHGYGRGKPSVDRDGYIWNTGTKTIYVWRDVGVYSYSFGDSITTSIVTLSAHMSDFRTVGYVGVNGSGTNKYIAAVGQSEYSGHLSLVKTFTIGVTIHSVDKDADGSILVFHDTYTNPQGDTGQITKLDSNLDYIGCLNLSTDRTAYCLTPGAGLAVIRAEGITCNPLELLADVMTDKRYGGGIDEGRIDQDAFMDSKRYCDDNSISIALSLDNKQPLLDWIDYIQSHYFGYLRLG